MLGQYNPSFVGVRIGPGIPFSSFTKGISTINNGFASIGGNVVVEGAYFYSKNVGFGGLISTSVFPVDEDDYGQQFVKNNCKYSEVIVDAEYYYTAAVMGGWYFDGKITNTIISLTAKLMAGFYWARNPAVNFKHVYSDVASVVLHQKSSSQSNFAFYYGVGAKFDIWENIGLSFNVDYISSHFDFYYYTLEDGEGNTSKQISYISTTIGAYLKL